LPIPRSRQVENHAVAWAWFSTWRERDWQVCLL